MIQQLTIDSPRRNSERGFSVIEILIVVAIITIMSAVAIPYVYSYRKLYKSEEQSLKVIDLMREANQMALNRRRTIRLELDMTRNAILLIDEGSVPAKLVKAIPLEQPGTLRMDVAPAGITIPDPPKYDTAVFANDAIGHMDGDTPVINNRVWAAKFKSDGSVTNATGTPISATIFVFPATSSTSDTPTDTRQVRAVTIYGGSGAVRYWKFNGTTYAAG